jgi:HSP20 family protein
MSIDLKLKKKNLNTEDNLLFPNIEKTQTTISWIPEHEEGQLAVDVCETEDEIILKSAIAGVTQNDLEVFLHNDMLTVRGVRHTDHDSGARWLVQECHWGPFSRSIILPADIDSEGISAILKDGVLTVRLPKIERSKKIKIKEL